MAHRFAHLIPLGLLALMLLLVACAISPPAALPQPTSDGTPEPAPGLVVQGHARLNTEDGPGLAGVRIYRQYASYAGEVVATTDQDGTYQSDFAPIPGDEMVTIWAELEGYTFRPERYNWRHYHGYESRTLDFVAVPMSSDVLRWRRDSACAIMASVLR